MKKYNAKATSVLFWLQESRITAQYIVNGTSKKDIVLLSKNENIYNAISDERKRKIANTTFNRVSNLPEDLINELATCNVDEAKIIVLLAIMLSDSLFHDFMIEVYRDHMITGINTIKSTDVQGFIEEKKELYESARKISEASVHKLGSTYIKYLYEAGVVEDLKKGNMIKPYIDYKLEKLLVKNKLKDFIMILTGE